MANGKITEAELITYLRNNFISVSTPVNPGDEGEVNGITKMMVNVVDAGKSELSRLPVASRRNITYYVRDKGKQTESAYFDRAETVNEVDYDIAVKQNDVNKPTTYTRIYNSEKLRNSVLGFIIKAIDAIFHESVDTADHAARLTFARNASKNPSVYLNAFMVQVACNPTVRSSGCQVADSDLEWIINSEILTVANSF